MKLHPSHTEILEEIRRQGGETVKDALLENYLGSEHPRYPISSPIMRQIIKCWASRNTHLSAGEFCDVVSSLVRGQSFTEKCMGGLLLGYAKPAQRKFDVTIFETWLEQLQGWAEIDALCTGKFALTEIGANFKKWKPFLRKLNRSQSVEKRRASLVFFTSPISHSEDDEMASAALQNIDSLKSDKDTLVSKAISWVLRSMIRHHRKKVEEYLASNKATLPAIAVRETMVKLTTGKKAKSKP